MRSIRGRCSRTWLRGLVVGTMLVTSGCWGSTSGPELIEVEGVVTLDGQPLPNATVRFVPVTHPGKVEYTRPAVGRTDEDGEYFLEYSLSREGALPGEYTVAISTFRDPGEDEEGLPVPGKPERVPDTYNLKSTLVADVSAEGGPYNFDLKSDAGEIREVSGVDFGNN